MHLAGLNCNNTSRNLLFLRKDKYTNMSNQPIIYTRIYFYIYLLIYYLFNNVLTQTIYKMISEWIKGNCLERSGHRLVWIITPSSDWRNLVVTRNLCQDIYNPLKHSNRVSPEYTPAELTLESTHSKYFWCENFLLREKNQMGKRGTKTLEIWCSHSGVDQYLSLLGYHAVKLQIHGRHSPEDFTYSIVRKQNKCPQICSVLHVLPLPVIKCIIKKPTTYT